MAAPRLSLKFVGRPIAFLSTGERVADFEIFHPDRLASRILGMGDVLSLIEQAERSTTRKSPDRPSSGSRRAGSRSTTFSTSCAR